MQVDRAPLDTLKRDGWNHLDRFELPFNFHVINIASDARAKLCQTPSCPEYIGVGPLAVTHLPPIRPSSLFFSFMGPSEAVVSDTSLRTFDRSEASPWIYHLKKIETHSSIDV